MTELASRAKRLASLRLDPRSGSEGSLPAIGEVLMRRTLSPLGFIRWGIVLAIPFVIAHLAGLRQYTS
jgi:hypothetical protein